MEEGLSAEEFYDHFATDYHLIFRDWWEAAVAHGEIIGRVLLDLGVRPGAGLLDCTCGIGTQALPLALRGYRVLASDVSTAAVAQTRREAAERDIVLGFAVCDVREVGRSVSSAFDAVIACDNSLPHLLTQDDLLAALRSIRRCLPVGGVFLASIRDYDELSSTTGVITVTYSSNGRGRIVGQAWRMERGRGDSPHQTVHRGRDRRWMVVHREEHPLPSVAPSRDGCGAHGRRFRRSRLALDRRQRLLPADRHRASDHLGRHEAVERHRQVREVSGVADRGTMLVSPSRSIQTAGQPDLHKGLDVVEQRRRDVRMA